MTAEDLALVVAGGHVNVRIKLPVHGVNRARERDNLESALEFVCVVFFLVGVENTDGEVVRRAKSGDGGKLNVLGYRQLAYLVKYLLAAIDANDDSLVKSFVLHIYLPFFLPDFAFFLGLGFAQPLA